MVCQFHSIDLVISEHLYCSRLTITLSWNTAANFLLFFPLCFLGCLIQNFSDTAPVIANIFSNTQFFKTIFQNSILVFFKSLLSNIVPEASLPLSLPYKLLEYIKTRRALGLSWLSKTSNYQVKTNIRNVYLSIQTKTFDLESKVGA